MMIRCILVGFVSMTLSCAAGPAGARADGAAGGGTSSAASSTGPGGQTAAAVAEPSLFDPAKDMRVSEVKPGMTGYGLSIFSGTKIERFNVRVISVLKNFNPKYDVVLIDCTGANLEHTGSIAGMSGSPIYLHDDQGRDRLIGAFAYGWPLTKDPVAGVQPIEYMLSIPNSVRPKESAANAGFNQAGDSVGNARPAASGPWSILPMLLGKTLDFGSRATQSGPAIAQRSGEGQAAQRLLGDEAPRMEPLATPLMISGIPTSVIDALRPAFAASGLVPMQAGSAGSGGGAAAGEPSPKFEPGSVLAVPLATGDAEMSAIGTCTDVIGNRVYGFGHSFNNEGPVSLPMGTGYINAIIANLNTSFKIGALSEVSGTLLSDQTVGVAGRFGTVPPMIPLEIRLHYTDGSYDQTYHFKVVRHPKLTPLVTAAAIGAAMSGTRDFPEHHTLDYDVHLQFANGQEVHLVNTIVDEGLPTLFRDISLPIEAAGDNPFSYVALQSITGTVNVTAQARVAEILSVNLPRAKYRPGATARMYVTYRPFRGEEAILPIDFKIPHDLPDGTYPLTVMDWQNYIQSEAQTHAFRFEAETADEVFAVMKDVLSLQHKAIYVELMQQPDGVAIGRTAMSHLPSSRRQVLMGAGLSNTTPFLSSTLKVAPTDVVMLGSAVFQIKIDREARVEAGSNPAAPAAPKHEQPHSPAAVPAVPKAEEPKTEPKSQSIGSQAGVSSSGVLAR